MNRYPVAFQLLIDGGPILSDDEIAQRIEGFTRADISRNAASYERELIYFLESDKSSAEQLRIAIQAARAYLDEEVETSD